MIYYLLNLYIILLLFSGIKYLFPPSVTVPYAVLREMTFVFLVVLSLFFACVKKKRKNIYLHDIFAFLYVVIILFYSLLSIVLKKYPGDNENLLSKMITYISGPVLFIIIPYFFDNTNITEKIIQRCYVIFIVYLFINLLVFPFQYQLLFVSSVPQDNIRNIINGTNDSGEFVFRFFGLVFMPTILAWICIVIFVFPGNKKITKLFSMVLLYLTRTRCFLPGLALIYFNMMKKKYRIFILPFIIMIVMFILYYSLNNLDIIESSASVHLDDLFFKGPSLIAENFMGRGFYSGIHLESDIYYNSIQFGVWGALIYMMIFLFFYTYLNKKCFANIKIASYGKRLTIIFFTASWLFPLTGTRILSNIFWILASLTYTYARIIYHDSHKECVLCQK
jgi:hypothetical protein